MSLKKIMKTTLFVVFVKAKGSSKKKKQFGFGISKNKKK